MKFLFCLLIPALFLKPFQTDKAIDMYDSAGNAVVYIDQYLTDQVIYRWDGKPLAYLHQSFSSNDVYGFNGKHLGWFEAGVLRDNEGYIIASTREASGRIPASEPMKGLKDTPPDKKFREQEPPKPYFGSLWSSTSAAEYLARGLDK